jgi:hypothetical protein
VLSTVKGGGIGLTVISKAKDSVKVKAPALPVKHFILGKTWNWSKEKYHFLKDRKELEKFVEQAKAKRIYTRTEPAAMYIVMYKKEIFQNGKTRMGETLEELARRHAKEFDGELGRILKIINGYSIRLTPENARRLGRLPEVRNIEEDRPVGINPPRLDR